MIRQILVGDVALSVTDIGDGPIILLIHGFPLDHSMWAGQWEELSAHFRLIAPDLRGFGKSQSTAGTVTMAQFADDLATVLDQLSIHQPVTWLGLSMGGYIGWEFIQRHRGRLHRAIMADTRAAADTVEVARGRELMADRVLREGATPLVEGMLPRLFSRQTIATNPDQVARIRQVMLAQSPQGIAAALRGMALRRDMRGELPKLDLPMLLVCGEHDEISTVAEMTDLARQIPGARFCAIPTAGHLAPLENPRATNAALLGFLQS